jgi:hypothetical protein
MDRFNRIINDINHLHEYEKKQLAIILISNTLTRDTKLETIKIITQ